MRKITVFVAVLASAMATHPRRANAFDYDGTRNAVAGEIKSFDTACTLASLSSDGTLFRYLSERATPYSWPVQWSPRKIMSTMIDMSGLPPGTSSADQRALWLIHRGLREAPQMSLHVQYDTNASADQSFFKERRTCSDRLAAQAKADFSFFVKAYSHNTLALSYEGSLTVTNGTWTSDVAERVANRDRDLYRQLYDFFQAHPDAQNAKLAVISRMRAVTAIGTADRASSARLEAGLSAAGGLGFASADMQVQATSSLGQTIQLQTINTLVATVRDKYLQDELPRSLPVPDITIQELPSRADVEARLHERIAVDRGSAWVAQQGTHPSLAVKVIGITREECDGASVSEQIGSQVSQRTTTERKYDESGVCRLDVETEAIASAGDHATTLKVGYRSLDLATYSNTVFVNALIRGSVTLQGRDVATQLPQWTVEIGGGTLPFSALASSSKLKFSCGDLLQEVTVNAQSATSTTVTLLAGAPLAPGCKSPAPTLRVVPQKGVPIEIPVSGTLVAP